MCLGIPGKIVAYVDPGNGIAKADMGGVRRNINVALLQQEGDEPVTGDWVLVHSGFALSKIDEREAEEASRLLEGLSNSHP